MDGAPAVHCQSVTATLLYLSGLAWRLDDRMAWTATGLGLFTFGGDGGRMGAVPVDWPLWVEAVALRYKGPDCVPCTDSKSVRGESRSMPSCRPQDRETSHLQLLTKVGAQQISYQSVPRSAIKRHVELVFHNKSTCGIRCANDS
eukprot:6491958-Amphidinium_carterae.1